MDNLTSRTKVHQGTDNDEYEVIDVDAIKKYLCAPHGDVFQLSDDGLTYKKPASLFGTPVPKIQEGSAYWNTNWLSLDDYLAQESSEEELKRSARSRLQLDPTNKTLKDEVKHHQDNVSKQRKIREVFGGNQLCHPNQLVSKRHLPIKGLCEKDTMYLIGRKVSDLQFLANKGLMTMEPWDFVRWRVGKLLMERARHQLPGRKSEIRSVIHNIVSEKSEDPLFRKAVVYSAHLQGRPNAYGSKKKKRPYLINGQNQIDLAHKPRRDSGGATAQCRPSKSDLSHRVGKFAALGQADKGRRERRARLGQKQQSTGYQGVNAYRQQKAAAQQRSSGGPCCG